MKTRVYHTPWYFPSQHTSLTGLSSYGPILDHVKHLASVVTLRSIMTAEGRDVLDRFVVVLWSIRCKHSSDHENLMALLILESLGPLCVSSKMSIKSS
jgi:hypothetical protein